MIKLGDLIQVSCTNVVMVIMHNNIEVVKFKPTIYLKKLKIFNPDILECEVDRLALSDNMLCVWLKEDDEDD